MYFMLLVIFVFVAQQFEQEQQEDSIIMIQPEGLKLSHSDIKKKDAPSVLQKDGMYD